MNFELTVAGASLPWRMHGSEDIARWLRSRPWLELGGVLAARTAPTHHEDLLAVLRREALAADGGHSDLRVWRLDEDDLARGLRSALEGWMEASPRTELDFLKLLGEALEVRPVLFLGWVARRERVGEVLHMARQVAETIPKLGFRTGFCLLLLHVRQPIEEPSVVLDMGGPVELKALKQVPNEDIPSAWRVYLHQRAAWEAGGDVERTLLIDTLRLGELSMGDDDGCERLLNQHARDAFTHLSAHERSARLTPLEALMRGPSEAVLPRGSSADASSLPSPGHEREDALSPWLARALLLEGRSRGFRQLCAARLVCTPLAELVLTRCFELEALQRTRLALNKMPGSVPEEVRARFERFTGAGYSLERELYPSEHPFRPDDAWAFASFGEFMENVVGLKPSLRAALGQLRMLRNAVAHGHYIGWKALLILWKTEQALMGA